MTEAELPPRAAEDDGEGETEEERGLLTVWLGDARYGLWVDEILEVVRTPPISRLPLATATVPGVTSVRGDLVPVLDLGVRALGTEARRPGRLILVRHEESETIVGLLVDGVDTLIGVRASEIRATPEAAPTDAEALATGVVSDDQGVVTILHLGRAAAPPEPETAEE
jgi:chemotaxis signal transduction protein